ncbi:MAG TPA: hypothetical protein VHL98_08605 [Microvirga sp.]|jgi:uncharacterized membrane protein YuzA (DUF378 family)|nr:hypothetical protein [Microvirga sp.]
MTRRYSHAPRPTAAPVTFTLDERTLTVDSGRKVDVVQLGAVEQVRLTYAPGRFAQANYRTTVRMRDGKTFSLSSLHWLSLIQVTDQGPAYGAFARTLLRAVAAASPDARFLAGRPPAVWGATAALAGAALLGMVYVVWRSLGAGAPGAALVGALVGLAGLWQIEPMVRLNRPRSFAPGDPPKDLVPSIPSPRPRGEG